MSTAEPTNEAHNLSSNTSQYTTPIFAYDGEGAVARKSFAGLPCRGPGGMVWGIATLG